MIIVDRQVCSFHLRPFHARLYLSVTVYSRFVQRCPVMYRIRGWGLRLVSAEVFRRTILKNNPRWVYSVHLNPSVNAQYSTSKNLATWAKRLNKASQCLYSLRSLGLSNALWEKQSPGSDPGCAYSSFLNAWIGYVLSARCLIVHEYSWGQTNAPCGSNNPHIPLTFGMERIEDGCILLSTLPSGSWLHCKFVMQDWWLFSFWKNI